MSVRAANLSRRARELPAGWWGMLLLLATEATVFGSLVATYFFLRVQATQWPMGDIKAPAVVEPIVLTAVLVATSVPMAAAASAALRRRTRLVWWLVLVVVSVQCAYITLQLLSFVHDIEHTVPPTANAYASAYTTLLGVHHAHVLVGIALCLWLLLRLAIGGLTRYRIDAVRNVTMYVHFVNVMAIVVLLTEISPSL